jgi:hypothetical protein
MTRLSAIRGSGEQRLRASVTMDPPGLEKCGSRKRDEPAITVAAISGVSMAVSGNYLDVETRRRILEVWQPAIRRCGGGGSLLPRG